MDTYSDRVIDAMGGTTTVSRLTKAAPSTVSSWRKNGLSDSRLDHLMLIAEREGMKINWESGEAVHGVDDIAADGGPSPGTSDKISQQAAA
jgi:hypothetical protein